ncbi:aldehyde dehydrogenase family protein [Microbacterium sp. NPDC076895]|uniref:aldehyde dehydrogenase family protein n=1 Tax=Microbacterium sp. NPDC076895 TaxID=3154957 RepID=UPI0034148F89
MTTQTTSTVRGYRTVNPATGELIRQFPTLSDGEAEELLARAHSAFLTWRETPIGERVRLFGVFADLLEANSDELARLESLEMGKPFVQSKGSNRIAASMFRYYAENGEALLADQELEIPGFTRAVTRREPIGVILGIEPWNGPQYQAMRATAPNLMLGNTVLLKPASISAGSTSYFDHLFDEAGFPPHVFQTALVSAAQISGYISDDRLRGVTLTGSDRAGSLIGEQAGRHIKPVVLELGGSDAFIVLDSADVDRAATDAATCRLRIGGQVCVSPKRVIVTDDIAEQFSTRYVETFRNQKVGDPFDPDTTIGPLSSADAADDLQALYQDAVDKGATVLVPGGRITGPGAYFQPAVLTDVTPAMRLYREEAFGPIGVIYRVDDADAAVALANDSPYGLGGTVFGDFDEARRVAGRLDTGSVGINSYLGAPIQFPLGGTKRSGIGRELGVTGMDQFANIKTYAIA